MAGSHFLDSFGHALPTRSAWRVAWLAVAIIGASACSRQQETIDLRPEGHDPPEVARSLSIGGKLPDTGNAEDSAVTCAAALRSTGQKLRALSNDARSAQAASQAADIYRRRAVDEAGGATKGAEVDRAISRKLSTERDNAAGEAQIAIACLRDLQS